MADAAEIGKNHEAKSIKAVPAKANPTSDDQANNGHTRNKTRRAGKIILALFVVSLAGILWDHYYFNRNCDCDISIEEVVKRWENLQSNLKREVFGQHIAVDGTLKALYAHITHPNPTKALVLSFHGSLGSGKTFMSQLVAKHFYKNGLQSSYVKAFLGPRHFLLDASKLKLNQEKLANIVETTVKNCERSLFIFDEVDKMPFEIFDVLIPFLDHHGLVDGINYRKSIFIFLSNTGGQEINSITHDHLSGGNNRESLSLYDFRKSVAGGAFKENGGLFKAQMITQRLVDHFIPFLPLEREHVILCAKREMKRRNVLFIDPGRIADRVQFSNKESVVFAEDGCKNVVAHVGYFVHYEEF